jgi:glucosamine kinase
MKRRFFLNYQELMMKRDQLFKQFAPQVTMAAEQGSSVARHVCNRAAGQLELGIELVDSNSAERRVEVAFIGSVICSPYMRSKLTELLIANPIKHYRVVEPQFLPVVGAILLAYKELGVPTANNLTMKLNVNN